MNQITNQKEMEDQIWRTIKLKEELWPLYRFETPETLQNEIDKYFLSIEVVNDKILHTYDKYMDINEEEDDDEYDIEEKKFQKLKTLRKWKKPKRPSLPWLARALWTTTFKLRDYWANKEYREVLEWAMQHIEDVLTDMAMRWMMNVNWLKFYLKNNNLREETSTTVEKKEIKQTIDIIINQPSLKNEPTKVAEIIEQAVEIVAEEIKPPIEKENNDLQWFGKFTEI